jgi:acid phosphatase
MTALRRPALLLGGAAVLALAGCGGGGSTPRSSPAAAPVVRKVLVVIMENHSLSQMREGMPYTFSLAKRFGYAENYYAITHPSLPNYLAIAGGQTYGVDDDDPQSAHPLHGPSVFSQAIARHHTAALFAEDMPRPCALEPAGDYAVKHNPWAYFVEDRAACRTFDRPSAAFAPAVEAGRLPEVGMLIPNMCHNAHDCDLSVADDWFRRVMQTVFAGPDWQSGHLAVVLTADEDDHNEDHLVLTVVVHPSQDHHVVSRRLDHYSLTRLYDNLIGAPYLGNAARAASLSEAFGFRVG